MDRPQTLHAAHAAVTHGRAGYGTPADNFARVAAYWGQHLGVVVTASDVAVMMVLLKAARLRNDPGHEDSWVDIAGYAACGAEVSSPAVALGLRAVADAVEGE